MKRILCFMAMISLFILGANAQEFELKSVNGSIAYSINSDAEFNQLGFNAGVTFGVVENLELVPSLSYYVKNDGIRSWDLNANLQYKFAIEQSHKFSVYPIVGIVYKAWFAKIKDARDFNRTVCNKLGFNVGAGVAFDITKEWGIFVDGKYQWFNHKYDQGVISAGVSYKF